MNTTAYYVELFIAGLLTCIWMALLAVAVMGDGQLRLMIQWHPIIDGAAVIQLAVFLPLIYLIGVVSDRIYDGLFSFIAGLFSPGFNAEKKAKHESEKKKNREYRARLYLEHPEIKSQYEYNQMRKRLCRSWCVAGPLIGLFFLLAIGEQSTIASVLAIVLAFGIAETGAVYAWNQIDRLDKEYLELQSGMSSSLIE